MKTSIRILAILFGLFLSVGAFAQSTIPGKLQMLPESRSSELLSVLQVRAAV